MDYTKCRICGQTYPTPAHLKHKHDGMTMKEYREKYNSIGWGRIPISKSDSSFIFGERKKRGSVT